MKSHTFGVMVPVILAATVAVVLPVEDAIVAVPFIAQIDWPLVGIVGVFGLIGALPRIDPIRTPQVWRQLSSGVVGGLVGGLGLADWFLKAPKGVLVTALLGGYLGTVLLDAFARRLLRVVPGEDKVHGPSE